MRTIVSVTISWMHAPVSHCEKSSPTLFSHGKKLMSSTPRMFGTK